MPIPWLVILQSVPWTDVIRNAPKVADGAKKLWSTVRGRDAGPGARQPAVPAANATLTVSELQARLAATEQAVSDLHAQMLASSELIKSLAEQNTQLVQRIEANRRRTLWLAALAAIAAVIALAALLGQ
jgi:hypothetical protein